MSAFDHVVVGLDRHEAAAKAVLARACELAAPAAIEVVHACSGFHHQHLDYAVGNFDTGDALDVAVREEAETYLHAVCAPLGIANHHIVAGNAAAALHQFARERADLVVVGSHGHHALRAAVASTSNATIHGTPCDVLAVHVDYDNPVPPTPYRTVLAAVDLTDESFQVLEDANRVALHCGADLAVANVSPKNATGSDNAKMLAAAERLGNIADSYGIVDTDIHEVVGQVGPRLHDIADAIDADLIVVGTHGKSGLKLLTGSTANQVLHGARCDVLAARMR